VTAPIETPPAGEVPSVEQVLYNLHMQLHRDGQCVQGNCRKRDTAAQLAPLVHDMITPAVADEEPRELKDGTSLKVGDLREAMDGLPDDAQMFVSIAGQGEDFAVKQAWASQQVPDGVKDWRTAGTVVGLEIHLGLFEETW
jgi:hypothetical protein